MVDKEMSADHQRASIPDLRILKPEGRRFKSCPRNQTVEGIEGDYVFKAFLLFRCYTAITINF
jgi:hypothetical protein